MLYDFGTLKKDGTRIHNTHRRNIKCKTCYEWECLLAGEELPKKWKNGEVVEWEFLEKGDWKE